jgi:type II secretory pathway pseudopilin PulG
VSLPIYVARSRQLYWDSNCINGNKYKQYLIPDYFADRHSPNTTKYILNFIAKKILNMKNKELYKLLKKNKSNAGFTLTELLVGLFMSIFVIGALGFGLMTVLATSQSETSKVKARTENSRALDFISDEVKRARNIETNVTIANVSGTGGTFSLTDSDGNPKTPVFALDIPEINSRGKIVYYLKSTGLENWKGPQVLYRWGPPLNANGEYTAGTWTEQALIDGINDTTVTSPCSTGTVTPATPKGFYACITGTNTAQLFLTGQTKTASGVNNDSQTNDSQVVARARETLANKMDDNTSISWNVEGLGGNYKCKDVNVAGVTTPEWWHMRTDFSNSATPDTDPNKVSWTQNPNITTQAQPQPIEIKDNQPLTITSNPLNATGCDSSSASVSHTINFGNPKTFNGYCDASRGSGSCPTDASNPTRVNGAIGITNETVQFFKQGSSVPQYGTNALGQETLGKFLYNKGWAIIDSANNTTTGTLAEILNNRDTKFKIPSSVDDINAYKNYIDSLASLTAEQKTAEKARLKLLGEDQRIIGFEIGVHADTTKPGFDLQDNIFIVTSDVFKQKFAPSCFSGTTCSPATGKPPVT